MRNEDKELAAQRVIEQFIEYTSLGETPKVKNKINLKNKTPIQTCAVSSQQTKFHLEEQKILQNLKNKMFDLHSSCDHVWFSGTNI